jgi:predicted nucleic acid-binding protein
MLTTGKAAGTLTTDAHLATLAIEHGATVYTTDREFLRFPGVRVVNPIAKLSGANDR